jgi:hypothetical protein
VPWVFVSTGASQLPVATPATLTDAPVHSVPHMAVAFQRIRQKSGRNMKRRQPRVCTPILSAGMTHPAEFRTTASTFEKFL